MSNVGHRAESPATETSRVALPPSVRPPFQVYINGVPQEEGKDFRLGDGELLFERRLAREGKLGFWRWLSMWLGIAGSYRKHETVDIVYEIDGKPQVAAELRVVGDEPPGG